MRTDLILRQISKRHVGKTYARDDVFLTEVKNGKTWDNRELLRMDAIAIRKSWVNPCVTGYEVKVSRNDFLRDDKWPGYLNYCNEFYFACPVDLIQPEELPPEVGLIYYNPEKDNIRTIRKAVYRQVEIPVDMLWYLIMTRVKSDNRHPFFSSQREMLEAWVEDKVIKKQLGLNVANKTFTQIYELKEQVKRLESQIKRYEHDIKTLSAIQQIAINAGCNYWNARDGELVLFFEKLIKQGITYNPNIEALISDIERAVENLRRSIKLERRLDK